MATSLDYYEILGVDRDATADQVRSAYRKLAAKYHPDRNPGDREIEYKFKGVCEAYTVLSDDGNRRKYDAFRQAKKAGWNVDDGVQVETESTPQPSYTYPVADVSVEMELGKQELEQGCLKAVSVSRTRTCPDCRGFGYLGYATNNVCVLCHGAGCPRCGGQGSVQASTCNRCWGRGSDKEQTRLIISVPPRTSVGTRQRFLASGILWDRLAGMFYVDAFVKFR